MTTYDRNYAKPNEDGTPSFGPMPLYVDIHRHEEWDEPVLDPETGEPTGETEHRERDWIERRTFIHPAATDFYLAGYLPLVDIPPKEDPETGMRWAKTGKIVEYDGRYAWEYAQEAVPPPPPRTFRRSYLAQWIRSRGKWGAFSAFLGTPEAEEIAFMWEYCTEFDENSPMWDPAKSALKAALGLTDEETEEMLAFGETGRVVDSEGAE